METELLQAPVAPATPRFAREMAVTADRDALTITLERERARRLRAEHVASDMARMVAAESRRAEEERELRLAAQKVADSMAALVAHENARADAAERRVRELLES
jgi:hypothetical protein